MYSARAVLHLNPLTAWRFDNDTVVLVVVENAQGRAIARPNYYSFTLVACSLLEGGRAFAFHTAPITYGAMMSPRSNATRTSSSTSGMNKVPRFCPAIMVATRA